MRKIFVVLLFVFTPGVLHAGLFYVPPSAKVAKRVVHIENATRAANATREPVIRIPKVEVSGVTVADSRGKVAVINGKYFKEGDLIDNCTLAEIHAGGIKLKCGKIYVNVGVKFDVEEFSEKTGNVEKSEEVKNNGRKNGESSARRTSAHYEKK